ncbi:MAG: ElyC/SanA/YdcF family protein [Verrucomicrobiota bacterium]
MGWKLMEQNKTFWGLLCRRQCLVPTWRGCLLLSLSIAVLALLAVRQIHPFLAVTDSVPGGVLVVEGWVPDCMLEAAISEFKRNHYARLFVTGIALEQGAPLSHYENYATLGAATLVRLGLSTNDVQAVPTGPTRRDRTYATALTLKHWLREHDMAPTKLNLITGGPHARRSRLMFEKALGKGVTVGVLAIPADDYDERQWWHYSQGVRSVISESLAYLYARLLFFPPQE